jgi:DNA repair exonuclease SbcCD ATPase subunit
MSTIEKVKKKKKEKVPVIIPSKAHIKIYWDDFPENNSYEGKKRIKSYFGKKYNISEENINVVFRAKKRDKDGNEIKVEEGVIDNIMDITYQRDLFKQWLKREDITVEWDRIIALDDKVNEILNQRKDTDYRYRRWYLNKVEIDNFLSFGEDNVIDYTKLNGVNLVTSDPPNTGGKTTFSVDVLMFLFFGTTTKTSKNEDIFNTFTDKNKLSVKGYINIDGQDYVIERSLSRKAKKDGSWSVTASLEYFKVLPDGSTEDQKGEARQQTEKIITESIGTDSDFLTTIIATSENIEGLIESKPTERGKIFTKFIGLEVIEEKETICKELSTEFRKKMKSNQYDTETLKNEIDEYKTSILETNLQIESKEIELEKITGEIATLQNTKDLLVEQKKDVDPKILKLNEKTIQSEIDALKTKGKNLNTEIKTLKEKYNSYGEIEFDQEAYDEVILEEKNLTIKKSVKQSEVRSKSALVKQLEAGEICPTCKRALDDVDNTDQISLTKEEIEKLTEEINQLGINIESVQENITEQKGIKSKIEEKERFQLLVDKKDVEIQRMRLDYTEKTKLMEEYKNNESIIQNNQKLQSEIVMIESNIMIKNRDRDQILTSINNGTNRVKQLNKDIESKEKIIESIKKEEEIDRIFTIYEKMIGKNGISKLIIKSVVPILNSEIEQLLDNIADFGIELRVSDKNEIEFLIVRGDVLKNLSTGSGFERTIGSLALRTVLGRVSTLPKPNIIVFDEVFGRVADENLPALSMFFEKIKAYFDIIFLITFRDHFKELADQQIMIKKTNNISKFSYQ